MTRYGVQTKHESLYCMDFLLGSDQNVQLVDFGYHKVADSKTAEKSGVDFCNYIDIPTRLTIIIGGARL